MRSSCLLVIAGLAAPLTMTSQVVAGDAWAELFGLHQEGDEAKSGPVSRGTVFHIRGAAWLSELSGNVSVGDPIAGAQSDIDLIDTLGLDSDKLVLSASMGVNIGKSGRFHVDIGFNGPFSYDGSSGNIDIAFNNQRYQGSVESTADFNIYQLDLGYDFIQTDVITLNLGGGTRIFDIEASVEGTATDPNTNTTAFRKESESVIAPLPGLGGSLRVDITSNIYIKGSGKGIYAGNYGNFYDVSAEIGVDITRNFGVFAGYRIMHGEADVGDVNFDVQLDGFYAGAEVRF